MENWIATVFVRFATRSQGEEITNDYEVLDSPTLDYFSS